MPQLSAVQGLGMRMVPTNVVPCGLMWNDSSSAEVVVASVGSDLSGSDLSRWVALEGIWSRGKSEKPSSKRPWAAILTLSVRQSHQRKFLVVIGEHPRNVPLRALVLNFADLPVGGLTHTLHPKVLSLVQFSFFPVVICTGLSDWFADGRELKIRIACTKL